MDYVPALSYLTERDFQICADVFDHRFLTTTQIQQLHFDSSARARVRTKQLYDLGVLDRFRPPRQPGSYQWHYVLDLLGVQIVSDLRDIDADKLYLRRNRPLRLLESPRLDHMRDINEFFCRLTGAGRQNGPFQVTRWLGEAKSAAVCQELVNPDGIGTITRNALALDFFFELDRGTESAGLLERKMLGYRRASIADHLPKLLLFCFASPRREQSARRILSVGAITIATSTLPLHLEDPLAPIWLPLNSEQRLSLVDIPLARREPR
ncbi:MAG: replication-relaxation family protein [Actinomycetota bacterium]